MSPSILLLIITFAVGIGLVNAKSAPFVREKVPTTPEPLGQLLTKFNGKWKLTGSENYDAYLTELGVGWWKRRIANRVKPVFIIEATRNGHVKMTTSSFMLTHVAEFDIGHSFDEMDKWISGLMVRNLFTMHSDGTVISTHDILRGDKLKSGHHDITVEYHIDEEDKLILTCKTGDVVAKRIYERIA